MVQIKQHEDRTVLSADNIVPSEETMFGWHKSEGTTVSMAIGVFKVKPYRVASTVDLLKSGVNQILQPWNRIALVILVDSGCIRGNLTVHHNFQEWF